MICIGTDLIEIKRIKESINKYGERFLKRIYTDKELEYCLSKKKAELHFAARFAAKEAAMKCFGFVKGYGFKDIEILNRKTGKPDIYFSECLEKIYNKAEYIYRDVSLTHTDNYASAVVVFTK